METVTYENGVAKTYSQKDATFRALCLAKGLNPDDLTNLNKDTITKQDRAQARERIKAMILDGLVKCKPQYEEKALNKYCSGLISNWLAKDKRYFKAPTQIMENNNDSDQE